MTEKEPEMGRFDPKGNPNEPREPFVPHETPKTSKPSLSGLHLPQGELDEKKFRSFLIELRPIIEHIQEMSRDDQHAVGTYLHEVKEQLHAKDFPEEMIRIYEKAVEHYNDLLMNSKPEDQQAALENINLLLNKPL